MTAAQLAELRGYAKKDAESSFFYGVEPERGSKGMLRAAPNDYAIAFRRSVKSAPTSTIAHTLRTAAPMKAV